MDTKQLVTRLKRDYLYNQETGDFYHLKRGSTAGYRRKDGYVELYVGGMPYLAHRMAWLYTTGQLPHEVDHKNGVRSDNRWSNLREASRSQNNGNSNGWSKSKRKNNLPRGVYINKALPHRFLARIEIGRRCISLGSFDTVAEAETAYKEAAHKHFGVFVRSNRDV
jgi:hypothetical protein